MTIKEKQSNVSILWDKLPIFIKEPEPNVYISNNYVYIDFETTNHEKGSPYNEENSLVFTAFTLGTDHPLYEGQRTYTNWGSEYEQGALVNACEMADFIVAHNAKFELGWLNRCGLDISRVLPYCTQIGEYVRAGNRKWKLSLEESLKRYGLEGKGKVISLLLKGGICPSIMPQSWLKKYGITDVVQGEQLFLMQREMLVAEGLLPVQFTRCIFTPVLESIERVGMHLDEDRVRIVHKKYTKELAIIQDKIDIMTGGINTKSPPQKANFLYNVLKFPIPVDYRKKPILGKNKNEDFPDGIPSTDAKVVSRFKPKTRRQKNFLELLGTINKLKDAKTKSLDKFLACVEETDEHILTAQLNQTITATHRLSSTGRNYKAQFQNFPRIFKPLFSARNPDWEIGEADEGQLEYRIAVHLGQDENGLEDILTGVDAHGFTASIIFKEEWESCGSDRTTTTGKKCRTDSKEHTFKPLYGGTSGSDREREYYQAFKDKHVGITNTQEDWKREVYQTKKLKTATGLTFYWEDSSFNRRGMLINNKTFKPVDQSVCNYPVQNLATAEVVPVAVTVLWHLMLVSKMESFLVNTVHDSAIAEINPKERELFSELSEYSMTEYVVGYLHNIYDINLEVPLEAEIDFGKNWATSDYWEEEYLNG